MSTLKREHNQNSCYNGCKMGGVCGGHKFELTIQNTSDVMEFKKDGKTEFIIEPDVWEILLEMVESMDYSGFEFKQLLTKAVEEENKAWRDGARCAVCGGSEGIEQLSTMCLKCFEEE